HVECRSDLSVVSYQLSMTDLFYASGTCSASAIPTLTAELTRSLRRPGRKTLRLIDKALSYLTPYENMELRTSQAAHTAHTANTPYCEADTLKKDLLTLLTTHRLVLMPYIDTDRIEINLHRL
ncbi:MAG: hypothetical protein K2N48_05085, partial [Muribaculaceae bacterium]|nr:hypothetical protein [Muribaculaceae bacterium]